MNTTLINGSTKIYSLLGTPIDHSLSPAIHNFAFQKKKINAAYLPIPLSIKKVDKAFNGLKHLPIEGFNVTVPFKEKILPHIDVLSPISKKIKAVNTVYLKNGKWYGTSTDGIGCVRALQDINYSLPNKTIAILGTGGVCKSIISSLCDNQIKKIFIFGRSTKSIHNLEKWSLSTNKKISSAICILPIENYKDKIEKIDLVINATPLGSHHKDPSPLDKKYYLKNQCFYDLIYKENTPFLKQAQKIKAINLNGLGMLVHQALESFHIWTGEKVLPKQIYDHLNKNI